MSILNILPGAKQFCTFICRLFYNHCQAFNTFHSLKTLCNIVWNWIGYLDNEAKKINKYLSMWVHYIPQVLNVGIRVHLTTVPNDPRKCDKWNIDLTLKLLVTLTITNSGSLYLWIYFHIWLRSCVCFIITFPVCDSSWETYVMGWSKLGTLLCQS